MKTICLKLRQATPALIYFVIYSVWFYLIENVRGRDYTIIHMRIDDKIPFCEYFIVPYLLWFVYVGCILIYLLFTNVKDFYKCCLFLFTGMTIFLVISTAFPNLGVGI